MATSSKTVELKLKVTPEKSPFVSASMAKIEEQAKRLQKTLVMQTKSADDFTKKLTGAGNAMRNLGAAATGAGTTMRSAFSQVGRTFDTINAKIDGFKAKFLNLRTLLVGSAIGAAAIGAGRKILSEGRGDFLAANRLRRRFGANAGIVGDAASGIAQRAGFDDDPVAAGLSEIFDATNDVQAGTRFRGKKLTEKQAAAIRAQTFGTGSKIFERLLKLNPEQDPENLGRIVAEAGTGSEGFRRLAGALGLNRVESKKIAAALEKGTLDQVAGPELAKKLGLKRGDKGTGSGLEVLLARTGQSEEAAADATKSFDFQMRSVGATIDRTIGDIGLSVFEKLNKEIGKGGDLAGKLQAYLASPAGKEAIDKTATAMAKLVDGVVTLVSKLPALIDFFEKHKTSLMLLGGAYVGVRGYGAAKGLFGGGGGSALGGAGGLGAPAGAVPVYVVGGSMGAPGAPGGIPGGGMSKAAKLGAAAGALFGGYALGTALDETFGVSDYVGKVRKDGFSNDWQNDTASARKERALHQYRGFERQIQAGTMTRAMAADALERTVGRIGVDSQFGSYLTSALATGNAASDSPTAGDLAKQKSAQVNFEIGNIVLQGASMNPEALVDAIMPKLRDQMVKRVQIATAGGAAPGGAR